MLGKLNVKEGEDLYNNNYIIVWGFLFFFEWLESKVMLDFVM